MKRIISLFVAVLLIASCTPNGTDGVNSSVPKIMSVKVSPEAIVYNGQQSPISSANISVSATGNPAPTVLINGEQGKYFNTPQLLSSGTYTYPIVAMNETGKVSAQAVVSVSMSSEVANLSQGWRLHQFTVGGVPTSFASFADDTTYFKPNGILNIHSGSVGTPWFSGDMHWYFDQATGTKKLVGWISEGGETPTLERVMPDTLMLYWSTSNARMIFIHP